jgi:hypothetical protein
MEFMATRGLEVEALLFQVFVRLKVVFSFFFFYINFRTLDLIRIVPDIS